MDEPASFSQHFTKSGRTPKQFALIAMGVFSILFGGTFVVFGWLAGQQASGASPTPVPTDLAKLEAGQPVPNIHVQVGPHLRLYPHSFFWYESPGNAPPTAGSTVESAFIPLISVSHPYAVRVQALAKKRGGLDKLTAADLPPLPKFTALLLTHRYEVVGDIPHHLELSDGLHGLVNNQMFGLEDEERELLKKHLPGVALDKILIILDDRSPASDVLIYLLKFGGGALFIMGVIMLIVFKLSKSKSPATAPLSN